ncbi:protein serine/threonine kinase, putative [Entamoeba invadens IP1]|uniref:Protein serine/threonine kinase, putative n=1 Tax=Entamoeba invadens IP1 TaxID=370355 RepID=A0A0A1TX53_ENTIV|nr:protein serine/threonine kinase, putative [Entamoeba invadens IP1]ELP83956.1 protein serine/threonine kinase, putative [Entamoeba invadens IP1]|eukprot:XP_004183302.1 protein serine/threonine kinase, putative [Entamoeba invadens IP1]
MAFLVVMPTQTVKLQKIHFVTKQKKGFLNDGNLIINCNSGSLCLFTNGQEVDFECALPQILSDKMKCFVDQNCIKEKSNQCVKCSKNHHIINGGCVLNEMSCLIQNQEICLMCNNTINNNGIYIDSSTINCDNYDSTCNKCEDGFYKSTDKCLNITADFPNCEKMSPNILGCAECITNFYLNEHNKCNELEIVKTTKNTKIIKTNSENEDVSNCLEKTTKGCVRCSDTYYLQDYKCIKCEYPCVKCKNLTYCTGCDAYSYTNNKGDCIEINDLLSKCDLVMATYTGCVVCKDGYMRSSDGKACEKCDVSCKTCTNDGNCILCETKYYRTLQNSTKYFNPQSDLFGCQNKTTKGCSKCENGFYLDSHLCYKCRDNCTLCSSFDLCYNCSENHILTSGSCIHYSEVPNCVASLDNKCSSCSEEYKLDKETFLCKSKKNYGLIIALPVVLVFMLILLIISIIVVILVIIRKLQEVVKMRNICVFPMKKSNVKTVTLEGTVLSNKSCLTFSEDSELLPVDEESRELVCIGNKSKGILKVQLTTRFGCDKYIIRTEPQLVTLKRGEACEFELITKKKLGEGSFGIVYKGSFRGNIVAIKKMKSLEGGDAEEQMKQFSNEVSMLNKFRSEYIVHFYGAVFIPNRVCMVTEFAQYGSLQDLINRTKINGMPRFSVRVKIMMDLANGISYLQANRILHRDIKPDNILVFSLDVEEKVNGKLTDFGSSRNINLMMTNMTFTKGIGTPMYMAPEVLNQEKYTKGADVFSFGVTMYETFGWSEAYNKIQFKFPWKIAEFVINRNRLPKKEMMSDKQYELIDKCWKHENKQRPTIIKKLRSNDFI